MNPQIINLHTHWCIADSIKPFITPELPIGNSKKLPNYVIDFSSLYSKSLRLSVYYALLYVVIEGFQEFRLTHLEVEELLKEKKYVESLRIFRNAIFHTQKNPSLYMEKMQKFLDAKDSEKWIKALNKPLEKFFLDNLPIKQIIEEICKNK